MRRRAFVVLMTALTLLGVLAFGAFGHFGSRLAIGYLEDLSAGHFYDLPSNVAAGVPGELVRTERLYNAPAGASAWRVLYHSTDGNGKANIVSGIVVVPRSPAPAAGRMIVGWGHPTTGAAARCAPSRGIDPFLLIEGLRRLLDEGYIVAAADYPGLGVDGPSSYLIGGSEGHSVLDAVRAAQRLVGRQASGDVLLWGHSQGGQAVLFAAQEAKAYAPELRIRAVAVAAPAAELATLLDDDIGDVSGITIGSYAFAAYEAYYQAKYPGLALTSVLTQAGAAATPGMAQLCLLRQNKQLHAAAKPLLGKYLRANPSTTKPWAQFLAENTPGHAPLGVPLFVAQGESDTLVHPAATLQFVRDLCAANEHVTLRLYPRTGHGLIAIKAVDAVTSFFVDVLRGRLPATTC